MASLSPERWTVGRLKALVERGAWFASLPPDFALKLLTAGKVRRYRKGEIVVDSDEPTGLWAVLRGAVVLSRIGANGNEFMFYVARPGFWMGAFGIITGRTLDITATALVETTMLSITRGVAEQILASNPRYVAALAQLSMERFAHTLNALEQTSRLSAVGRVAAKLLSIRALDIESDFAAVDLPLAISQSALALMTSLSRQSVGGALRDLAATGAVAVGFREIRILDLPRLEAIAAEAR